jgi:hypothetical protein
VLARRVERFGLSGAMRLDLRSSIWILFVDFKTSVGFQIVELEIMF